jgi:cell division control protein 45
MVIRVQANVADAKRYIDDCKLKTRPLTYPGQRPGRMSRDQRDDHSARLDKHYMAGTWYGQSASGTVYILATVLERVDNELLWCASLSYSTIPFNFAF